MNGQLWQRVGRSWLSMKLWIKLWLFFLNGVFLAAIFLLPDPIAGWTLIAYLACAPLLLGMVYWQGGLTRLLGLAHLIPWLPLLVYLLLRLTSGMAGTQLTLATPWHYCYTVLLTTVVAICLGFDFYDLLRWVKGERFVLGTPAAAKAGASRLTLPAG